MKTPDDMSKIRDHDFDGIYECTERPPRWWVYGFYGCIAFAVAYMVWFHVPGMPGESLVASYEKDLLAKNTKKEKNNEPFDFAKASQNKKILSQGKIIYDKTCAVCHGQQGEGTIGPNLTDRYWIHGSRYSDLVRVLNEGVPAKGMPAWGQMLGEHKTNLVLAYVVSLQGTNPPNAKPPQGEEGDLRE